MEHDRPRASKMWEYINKTHLSREKLQVIENFKSSSVNYKLSIWNPEVNGIRFLKVLVFYICSTLLPKQWEKLVRIQNREVGNPLSIKYNKEVVCLDYLQAVLEIDFMENYIDFQNSKIIEIGAGYGRTCHAVLSNYDISNFCIIDLKNSLELSKRYLKVVLDETQYNKITFIDIDSFEKVRNQHYDLCINIDSFAEMEENIVRFYFRFIDRQSKYFYVKNPVGKYYDKSLDSHSEGKEVVNMAMETGILKKLINIHDNEEIKEQSLEFVKAYCPSNEWECVGNECAKPWGFYWQAIYKRR